jgi:hypothetical protein
MRTYIIDWGKDAIGARYALVQAKSLRQAWLDIDCAIGEPKNIKPLRIPKSLMDIRYLEIESPKDPIEGCLIKELNF